MTPSLVTIGYKYQLESNETNPFYLKLYNDCKIEFTSQMRFIQEMGYQGATDFGKLRPDFKVQVSNSLNGMINSVLNYSNLKIPQLKDETGRVEFKPTSIHFNIEEGNTEENTLILNLFFETIEHTLVGTISDKLILAVGDMTNEIKNSTELTDLIFLKHTSDLWFTKYKKI